VTPFRAEPPSAGPPEPDDEVLRRIVAELRRPVSFGPGVDAGALRAIRARGAPARPRRLWWLGGTGVAAALAATLLLLVAPHRVDEEAAGPRRVVLRLVAPASSAVFVVGDFNDWSPVATPLQLTAKGEWIVRLALPPGRYRYTFLVDGHEWKSDPAEPPAPNDYGAPTSVLTVS
jgi:hypothetical protein